MALVARVISASGRRRWLLKSALEAGQVFFFLNVCSGFFLFREDRESELRIDKLNTAGIARPVADGLAVGRGRPGASQSFRFLLFDYRSGRGSQALSCWDSVPNKTLPAAPARKCRICALSRILSLSRYLVALLQVFDGEWYPTVLLSRCGWKAASSPSTTTAERERERKVFGRMVQTKNEMEECETH